MGAGLQVELGPPQHGSLVVTLRTDEQELVLLASYVPFDSLTELAGALVALLEWQSTGVARFNCEPDGYDLRFARGSSDDRTLVHAVHFPFARRRPASRTIVLSYEGSTMQVGRCFWRAFRRLETTFDRTHWSYDFPSKLVARLGALTRS